MCGDDDRFPPEGSDSMKRWGTLKNLAAIARVLFLFAVILVAASCGYHTVGHADALPPTIRTIAIPGFVSHSQTFRIEQLLTDAVVREFNARTQFPVRQAPPAYAPRDRRSRRHACRCRRRIPLRSRRRSRY